MRVIHRCYIGRCSWRSKTFTVLKKLIITKGKEKSMTAKAEKYYYGDFTEEKYHNIIKLAHERGTFCTYNTVGG